jgi:hypothetical protein
MILDIKNREQVESAQFVLTVDFFSNKTIQKLAEKAQSYLHRDIEISATKDAWKPVQENGARLTNLYNNGFKMKRMTIGPVYYYEGVNALLKSFKFIEENGYTNELCKVKIDLGFSRMNEGARVTQLNKFKFLLNFNEAKAFELWPQEIRSSKIYKHSINLIYPKNKFIYEAAVPSGSYSSQMEFSFPRSKQFGINFDRISEGFVTIKYIGGKDYEKRSTKAVDLLNLVIESLFKTLKSNSIYSDQDKEKIKEILTEQKEHLLGLKTYSTFESKYPLIKLSMDLDSRPEVLATKFNLVREKLFDLITYGGLVRGKVNYNSETSNIEVYEGRIKNGFNLSNIVFIESSIQAEISECTLVNCKVRSSRLLECTIFDKNDIRYSSLSNCNFNQSGVNTIQQSTIKGKPTMQVAANLTECLVVGSPLAYNSTKDSKTEIAL